MYSSTFGALQAEGRSLEGYAGTGSTAGSGTSKLFLM